MNGCISLSFERLGSLFNGSKYSGLFHKVLALMFRLSHFLFFVFGHFWQNAKILRNLCLHFARQDGQGGKNGKKNATKVTKIPKTERRKYGMNET